MSNEYKITFEKGNAFTNIGLALAPMSLKRAIGVAIVREVKRNFDEGGRPVKWQKSRSAEGRTKTLKSGEVREGKTLVKTGALRNSIHYWIAGEDLYYGTNLPYAAIHNYGGDISVSNRMRWFLHSIGIHLRTSTTSIHIPKREFMNMPSNFGATIDSLYSKYFKGAA